MELEPLFESVLGGVRHAVGNVAFLFIYPGSRVFVGWLALFALTVLALRRWRGRRDFLAPVEDDGSSTALATAFPKKLWWSSSAKVDYGFFITERLADLLVLTSAAASSGLLASFLVDKTQALLGLSGPAFSSGIAITAAYTLVALFMYDVGYFVGHYLGHRIPLLWEFHKLHHVATVLTPATNFRVHPVDGVVIGTCIAITVGLTDAAFILLFGPEVRVFEVAGTNALFMPVFVLVSFRHSHVWIPFGPRLSRWLSSPAMHQVHHSRDEKHWDKNLCQIFSCLDRVAGTLYVPEGKEELEFGVPEYKGRMNESVLAMYLEPFVGAFRLVFARSKSEGATSPDVNA